MLGAIIKKDGEVIGKNVYAGDEASSLDSINNYIADHPDLSVEVFMDTNVSEFNVLNVVKPTWDEEKAKGTDAAIAYLAKHLGLEAW